MGEPIHTTVTVKKSQANLAIKTLKNFNHFVDCSIKDVKEDSDLYIDLGDGLCLLILGDVSYGNITDESDALVKQGIAHNVRRDGGTCVEASRDYIRFDDLGEPVYHMDEPDNENPMIDAIEVLNAFKSGGASKARKLVEDFIHENGEPSWKNQITYGKLHAQKC